MKANFEIELLPEAVDFLERLDEKARVKIYYNIKRHNSLMIKSFLKR